jgi:hypothetical protein
METPAAAAPGRERPRFDPPNILWFFGGLTAAAAGNAVVSQVHGSARGLWVLLVSVVFLAVFALLAALLLGAGWWVPGGVLTAMAVTFVVPGGVGFERLIGFWRPSPGIDPLQEYEGPVVALALATAAAGLIAFRLVPFPFVLAIVAAAASLGGQFLLPVLVTQPSPADHATAAIVIGVALIGVGLALDLRQARREAFWWYVFGLSGLALGLAYHAFRHASWGWILIFVMGTLFLLFATVFARATWAVFGVAGFFAPVAHYLEVWFGNLGTAFALGAVGLLLVAAGIGARQAPGSPRFDT